METHPYRRGARASASTAAAASRSCRRWATCTTATCACARIARGHGDVVVDQHLRQPAAVRSERGLRPLSAHVRGRHRRAGARRSRRAVRAARAGDVPDAAGVPRAAAAARGRAGGRVPAGVLRRRVHGRAEALQPRAARRRPSSARRTGSSSRSCAAWCSSSTCRSRSCRRRRCARTTDSRCRRATATCTPRSGREAPNLYRVLRGIADAIVDGRTDYANLEVAGRAELHSRGWKVDYIAVRHGLALRIPHPEGFDHPNLLIVLAAADARQHAAHRQRRRREAGRQGLTVTRWSHGCRMLTRLP